MSDTPDPGAAFPSPVAERFEAAWKVGLRPRIEPFLEEVSQPERAALLGELVAVDVAYRRRAGESPAPEDYWQRFPALDPAWLAELIGPLTDPRATVDNRGGQHLAQ